MKMNQLMVRRARPLRREAGYTLLEMMIVITIIGVLLGIAVVNFKGVPDDAKLKATKQEIKAIDLALDLYRMDNGRYPTNEQGLKALVEKPADAKKWKTGGYLGKLPVDDWGNPYKFLNPGAHGEIDIYSLGSDGRESEDDIGSWNTDE